MAQYDTGPRGHASARGSFNNHRGFNYDNHNRRPDDNNRFWGQSNHANDNYGTRSDSRNMGNYERSWARSNDNSDSFQYRNLSDRGHLCDHHYTNSYLYGHHPEQGHSSAQDRARVDHRGEFAPVRPCGYRGSLPPGNFNSELHDTVITDNSAYYDSWAPRSNHPSGSVNRNSSSPIRSQRANQGQYDRVASLEAKVNTLLQNQQSGYRVGQGCPSADHFGPQDPEDDSDESQGSGNYCILSCGRLRADPVGLAGTQKIIYIYIFIFYFFRIRLLRSLNV